MTKYAVAGGGGGYSGHQLERPPPQVHSMQKKILELEIKVHTKVHIHGEGPYYGFLLVENSYYFFHIKDTPPVG